MQKTTIKLPEIKLVGITCRTNNAQEMDPSKAKIGITAQKYFQNKIFEQISKRKKPGTSYCVYTNYENDFTGDYTYFIGEEVIEFDNVEENLEVITIPAQFYAKFTNGPDKMPEVCINAWKQIWNMSPLDFEGERSYVADFEIYDERSLDPQNTILDIYIGITK